MTIQEVYNDPCIIMLEEDIIDGYAPPFSNSDETLEYLLSKRRDMLNSLFEYNEENARLLTEFNQALRQALTDMYHRGYVLYDEQKKLTREEPYLEAICYLPQEYAKNHPIQTERADKVWGTLTSCGVNAMYDAEGIESFDINGKEGEEYKQSLMQLLFLDEQEDNWNEGLPRDWSKDMGLVHGFHTLYEGSHFSLYDLLYVREFNLVFKTTIDETTPQR